MTKAQEAIKTDEAIERIGRLLDDTDREITGGTMEAETVVRPSRKASSHCWSPELAMSQRKAALGRKYDIAMRKPMR